MLETLNTLIDVAIRVHIALLAFCLYRLWTGRHAADRLLVLELVGGLVLAIIVLLALRKRQGMLLDVALGLAAAGFAASLLLAKYLSESPGIDTPGITAPAPGTTTPDSTPEQPRTPG